MRSAVTAMRDLAAARHLGKVVLQAQSCLPHPETACADGRWVVSGGTGALGALAGNLLHYITKKSSVNA